MTAISDKDAKAEMKKAIRQILDQELTHEVQLQDFIIKSRTDRTGDEYLHAYIICQGKDKDLDPKWRMQLPSRLWERSTTEGYTDIPIQSFVPQRNERY